MQQPAAVAAQFDSSAQLQLPIRPQSAERQPFPLLASLAPVIGAVLVWLITSSPFALLFAFLGPVIAIASLGDSAVGRRRRSRRDLARFEGEVIALAAAIERMHDGERRELLRQNPGPTALLNGALRDPERWRLPASGAVPVSLGLGLVASSLRLMGTPGDDEVLGRLVLQARTLRDAPVLVDAAWGIGVCGPSPLAEAVARGILVQVANLVPPESTTLSAETDGWHDALPYRRQRPAVPGVVRWMSPAGSVTVAVAKTEAGLPADCRVILALSADGARIVAHPHGTRSAEPVAPHPVSEEQAMAWAETVAQAAGERASLTREPPGVARFAQLEQVANAPGSLKAVFSLGGEGPITIDLVADGPHAVVGGTTGSGKSELLVSWILAMATSHGPEAVSFLLVDFKGGASFAPVRGLQQVVGLVTDLDERSARRALLSLRAELRFREQVLASNAARSIDELEAGAGMPRLVIVVDEYAALVTGFPDLHELFGDIAARGRSLGVHLVLCTQRPAGVVRDAVLANAALRLSLRVNNPADSVAVVGTSAGAEIPAELSGRALLSVAGGEPVPVQVAISTAGDAAAVAARWNGTLPPRRPWCDDLPALVELGSLKASRGIPFGLLDLPEEQRQETAVYDPERQGNLFVFGATRSGKSTLLSTLSLAAGGEALPQGIDRSWDVLTEWVAALRRGDHPGGLLLVDDLDVRLARFPDEYQQPFLDLVTEIMRSGGQSGARVAVSARRASSGLSSIAALCDARLLLRMADRQEHQLVGGDPALFEAAAPPGAGQWAGSRVQVALAPSRPVPGEEPGPELLAAGPMLVVSTRPGEFAVRLRAMLGCSVHELATAEREEQLEIGEATAMAGTPEDWQSHWALFGRLRGTVRVVFEGCVPADLRALAATRGLPPPLAQPGDFWVLDPAGRISRARLG